MARFVTSIDMVGLHGQFDYSCQFQKGINVIYGRNGSGKTTLLHILANVLNGDYLRFAALDFSQMEVKFSDGESVKIELEKESYQDHYHGYIKVDGQRIHEKQFCPQNPQAVYHEFEPRDDDGDILFGDVHHFESSFGEIKTQSPNFVLSAAYFPAFRTAIDAWAIHGANNRFQESHSQRSQQQKTTFARNLFGQFMPSLDYPATTEIENELNNQIRSAIANVSQADRTFFGDVPSKILEMLAQGQELDDDIPSLLKNIEKLSERYQHYPLQVESMWDKLSESVKATSKDSDNQHVTKTVLNAYREALNKIVDVQEESFAAVEKYLSSVNMFLEGKNIAIRTINMNGNGRISNNHSNPAVVIQHSGENSPMMSMSRALSSGERQIATLLYAATRLHKQDVILIDEPEISLNVDWQRKLLSEMEKQMPLKQLIVCTHSPIIGAKYRERMIELSPVNTQNPSQHDFDIFNEIESA